MQDKANTPDVKPLPDVDQAPTKEPKPIMSSNDAGW